MFKQPVELNAIGCYYNSDLPEIYYSQPMFFKPGLPL
jgi:hypothetical protein